MDLAVMRERVAAARVGYLATTTPAGRPHVVPCCFALQGDTIFSAVDAKPKSTLALARLDNVRAQPAVSLLVEHYDDGDWSQLWWVRVDALARVVADDGARDQALDRLAEKYPQYRTRRRPGAVLALTITVWRAWP